MPKRVEDSFSAAEAFRFAGISYREGDHWARTGVVPPSIARAEGTGTRRRYGFRDIVALRVVRALREAGLSLQRVRKAAAALRTTSPDGSWPTNAVLVTDGRNAWVAEGPDRLVALLEAPGQLAWTTMVKVGRLAEEVRAAVRRAA